MTAQVHRIKTICVDSWRQLAQKEAARPVGLKGKMGGIDDFCSKI